MITMKLLTAVELIVITMIIASCVNPTGKAYVNSDFNLDRQSFVQKNYVEHNNPIITVTPLSEEYITLNINLKADYIKNTAILMGKSNVFAWEPKEITLTGEQSNGLIKTEAKGVTNFKRTDVFEGMNFLITTECTCQTKDCCTQKAYRFYITNCGNGVLDKGETCDKCPSDCPAGCTPGKPYCLSDTMSMICPENDADESPVTVCENKCENGVCV